MEANWYDSWPLSTHWSWNTWPTKLRISICYKLVIKVPQNLAQSFQRKNGSRLWRLALPVSPAHISADVFGSGIVLWKWIESVSQVTRFASHRTVWVVPGPWAGKPVLNVKRMGQTRPLVCLFSFFSSTNFTEKLRFNGFWTRIGRVESEHTDHLTTIPARSRFLLLLSVNVINKF